MSKYDPTTQMMLAIFQRDWPDSDGSEIADTGRVLRLSGLAEKSEQCDLGWMPNLQLMSLIGEQAARSSEDGTLVVKKHDREFLAQIYRLATGNDLNLDHYNGRFCCEVLAIIGLLKEGKNGLFKPTLRMKDLVLKRFAELCGKEKKESDDQKTQ